MSLSKKEIILHWIVALGMISLVSVGIYMTEFRDFSVYGIHKSVGILLFFVILYRVFVRIQKGWPENISTGPDWEHVLAKVIHWALIISTIVMPISGMFGTAMAGRGLQVFGLELLASNPIPEGARGPEPINANLMNMAGFVHMVFGYVIVVSVVLHVAGAVKHHVIDKDNTLRRMLGK